MRVDIDDVLNKISLRFGIDSLDILIPQDTLIDLSLFKLADIDVSNLDDELAYQPKLFMLFQSLHAYVSEKASNLEAALKRRWAQTSLDFEHKLKSGDPALTELVGGRITDKKVENLVLNDGSIINIGNELIRYNSMVVAFTNILKGLDKRHDMLIQISTKRNRQIGSNKDGLF